MMATVMIALLALFLGILVGVGLGWVLFTPGGE